MQRISSLVLYPPNSTSTITRNLEDGLDYLPDWRSRAVQEYVGEILATPPKPRSQKLAKTIAAEPDENVIDLLVFHLNGRAVFQASIDYALRCLRANATNNAASKIKAMTLTDFPPKEIGTEFGAKTLDVRVFEHLFFDVRRYIKIRPWLRGICYPNNTQERTEEEMTELRMLQIAYTGGKTGVREDVLGKVPPSQGFTPYPPSLGQAGKKAVRRVSELYTERDLRTPPDEMDLKMVAFIGHHGKNLDQPIFAAQAADEVVSPPIPWTWERAALIDWKKLNLASIDVALRLQAHYRRLLRQKLIAAVDEAGPFGESNDREEASRIEWVKVLNELDLLGFGIES